MTMGIHVYMLSEKKGWGCQSVKGVCLGKNGTIVIVSFAETPYWNNALFY